MSRVGGARPGAGRPLGSVNRRSSEVLAAALAEGVTPIEYMLTIMRNEDEDPKRRDWAAEKLISFLHPRPSPTDRAVQIDLPDTSSAEGVDQALDRIIAAMASGAISPAEGQSFIGAVEARRKAIETGDLLERVVRLEQLKH